MRVIAIVLNVVLISTVIYLISQDSHMSSEDLGMAALFLSAPITSLAAFFLDSDESWIALYFKRKAMEEKVKINNLSEKNS